MGESARAEAVGSTPEEIRDTPIADARLSNLIGEADAHPAEVVLRAHALLVEAIKAKLEAAGVQLPTG